MMTSGDCDYSDSDTPSRYVAGALAEEETAAFEEHYFACGRCWKEVSTGTGARTALADVRKIPAENPRSAWWMAVAAAAVIAVVGLVTVRERSVTGGPDVIRGQSEESIAVDVSTGSVQVRVRWRPVAQAARYRVQVRNAEGDVIRDRRSEGTSAAFDDLSGRAVFIRVTALDAQGEEIARSPLVRAPSGSP